MSDLLYSSSLRSLMVTMETSFRFMTDDANFCNITEISGLRLRFRTDLHGDKTNVQVDS